MSSNDNEKLSRLKHKQNMLLNKINSNSNLLGKANSYWNNTLNSEASLLCCYQDNQRIDTEDDNDNEVTHPQTNTNINTFDHKEIHNQVKINPQNNNIEIKSPIEISNILFNLASLNPKMFNKGYLEKSVTSLQEQNIFNFNNTKYITNSTNSITNSLNNTNNISNKLPNNINLSEQQQLDNFLLNSKKYWTPEEDNQLIKLLKNEKNWKKVSAILDKTPQQCYYRYNKLVNNTNTNKEKWSRTEEIKLMELIDQYGKDWLQISTIMKTRTPEDLKERYRKKLDPRIKRCNFTKVEDELIMKLHEIHGHKWDEIAKYFDNRDVSMLKNRYYSHIRRSIDNTNNNKLNCISSKPNYSPNYLTNPSVSLLERERSSSSSLNYSEEYRKKSGKSDNTKISEITTKTNKSYKSNKTEKTKSKNSNKSQNSKNSKNSKMSFSNSEYINKKSYDMINMNEGINFIPLNENIVNKINSNNEGIEKLFKELSNMKANIENNNKIGNIDIVTEKQEVNNEMNIDLNDVLNDMYIDKPEFTTETKNININFLNNNNNNNNNNITNDVNNNIFNYDEHYYNNKSPKSNINNIKHTNYANIFEDSNIFNIDNNFNRGNNNEGYNNLMNNEIQTDIAVGKNNQKSNTIIPFDINLFWENQDYSRKTSRRNSPNEQSLTYNSNNNNSNNNTNNTNNINNNSNNINTNTNINFDFTGASRINQMEKNQSVINNKITNLKIDNDIILSTDYENYFSNLQKQIKSLEELQLKFKCNEKINNDCNVDQVNQNKAKNMFIVQQNIIQQLIDTTKLKLKSLIADNSEND